MNVREHGLGFFTSVYKQPWLDDMKIPDFTYVYDSNLDSDDPDLVFCHLRGFLSEEEAVAYAKSIDDDLKKKIFFFTDFKRAFVDSSVDD